MFAVLTDFSARRVTGRVELDRPGFTAHVDFVDGQVTGARYHHHVGRKAFARACRVSTGRYALSRLPGTSAPIAPFKELLHAARRLDEMVQSRAEAVGGLRRVWDVRFAALKRVLRDIPDEVNPILRLIDGRRSVGEIVEVSPHDERLVLRVLHRLLRMGILILPDAYVHAKAGYELNDTIVDTPASARIEPTWFDTSPPIPVSTPPVPRPSRPPRPAVTEFDDDDEDAVIPVHASVLPTARDDATVIPAAADEPAVPHDPAPEDGPPAPAPDAEAAPVEEQPAAPAPEPEPELEANAAPVEDEPPAPEPAPEPEPEPNTASVEEQPPAPVVEDEPVVDEPRAETGPDPVEAGGQDPAAPMPAPSGTDGPRPFGEAGADEDPASSEVEHTAPYAAAAGPRPLPEETPDETEDDEGTPEVAVTAWSVPPEEAVPAPDQPSVPPASATVGGAAAELSSTPTREAYEHDKAALENWLTEEDAFFNDRPSRYEVAAEEEGSRVAVAMVGLFVAMLVAFAIYGAVQFARATDPIAPAAAADLLNLAQDALDGGDTSRGCQLLDEVKRGVRHESEQYRRAWEAYEAHCR